jgi:hypothetical protein
MFSLNIGELLVCGIPFGPYDELIILKLYGIQFTLWLFSFCRLCNVIIVSHIISKYETLFVLN